MLWDGEGEERLGANCIIQNEMEVKSLISRVFALNNWSPLPPAGLVITEQFTRTQPDTVS
jgi:hypothetical protein